MITAKTATVGKGSDEVGEGELVGSGVGVDVLVGWIKF
jgi:hypothetical protein